MDQLQPYRHIVKYYECDRMGVTHHSNYFRFMEEARIDWMDRLGYGFERMEAEGVVSPVMEIACTFKRTTTFKDPIDIYLTVEELRTLKVSFAYTMKVGDTIVCTGRSKHCFLKDGRPIDLETHFPELYEQMKNLFAK